MMLKWSLGVLCVGMSLNGSAFGDLRVLFKFDESGIQAHQVVEVAGSGENYPVPVAELPVSPAMNVVIMKWADDDGRLLAITQMKDPRVSSSPEHVNPSLVSRVGLVEGAWVENGPDGADTVTIEFPENLILGLAAESWSVSLHADK